MPAPLDSSEFLAGFLAEAEEHLTASNANLLAAEAALKRGESHPRAVRELFRSLHTLKGLSAMVGAEPIVDIAHELETLLRTADRSGGRLNAEGIDLVLAGVRAISERVKAMGNGEVVPPAPPALIERVASYRPGDGFSGPAIELVLDEELGAKLNLAEKEQLRRGIAKRQRALTLLFAPSAEKAAAGLTITSVRERLSQLGELVKVLPRSLPKTPTQKGGVAFLLVMLTEAAPADLAAAANVEPAALTPIASREAADAEGLNDAPVPMGHGTVRVDVRRLDEALDCLSALVVTRAKLQRAVDGLQRGAGTLRDLSAIVGESGRNVRDLRAAIMRARMVSVAEMLERAPLLVRSVSRASGKKVALAVDAGAAELDKSVADQLFPAIVHLIRNAIDHAIELPDARRVLGKPEEGQIRIRAVERAGSQLELTVTDDGGGIDRAKVARRADQPVPQTDEALLALICRPGLSTLDQATHTSGRGVGMDIVQKIVTEDLGGTLTLATSPQGTTFTVRVPLSITILDAFAFECAAQTFVVPVSAVEDLAEVQPDAVISGPELGAQRVKARLFRHRGSPMPLLSVRALMGLPAAALERPKAIIVRRGAERVGFEVDRMMGQQEIVVRPVKDPLADVDGVTGSTDLGDGRPTLVLDLLGLCGGLLGAAQ